jgi:hypothetical protein
MEYPVLPNNIREINKLLQEHFGIDTESGWCMWRISWSNDQYEMRLTDTTPKGIALLFPEVMNMPKYSWIKNRWILENLVLIPEQQQMEIPQFKKSYECIWKFEDRRKEYIEPVFEAAKFIIDVVHAAKGYSPIRKYIDPESKEPIEEKKKRIDKLVEELFGDESSLLGRTITGEAIAMPQNYIKEK